MQRSWQRDLLPWLLLALGLLLLDQYTKQLILANYQLGEGFELTGFLNIVRVHNAGAAFSFLAGESGWQRWFFVGIALAAVLVIVWMLLTHPGQRMFNFALACILSGAIGNVIDRIAHGYVVDFIDFHWEFLTAIFYRGHFPAFNVADTAISIGAVALIVDELLRMRRLRRR